MLKHIWKGLTKRKEDFLGKNTLGSSIPVSGLNLTYAGSVPGNGVTKEPSTLWNWVKGIILKLITISNNDRDLVQAV